jgi:hypothetical protein
MNTYARAGRNVLKLLFKKMNLFSEPRMDGDKILYPTIPDKREVKVSDDLDIEKGGYKPYHGITKGRGKREYRCRIFTWGAVAGLIELPLQGHEKETLMHIICQAHMRFKLPSHIIIAENVRGFTYDDRDNVGKILSQTETETITIYTLDETQKIFIRDAVQFTELRKFFNKESKGVLDSPIE